MSASYIPTDRHEDASSLVWPFVVLALVFAPEVLTYFLVAVPSSIWAVGFMKKRFLEADERLRMALSGETTPEKARQSIEDLGTILMWAGFLLPIPIVPLTIWAGCYFTGKVEEALD